MNSLMEAVASFATLDFSFGWSEPVVLLFWGTALIAYATTLKRQKETEQNRDDSSAPLLDQVGAKAVR